MYVLIGFLLIVMASLLEAFCDFGRAALPQYKPGILKTRFRWVVEGLWILLLLAGGVALLIDVTFGTSTVIVFVIAIAAFWLIFPFLFTPIMRRRLLPHWEEVRRELAPKGLNENNYWRNDWWMLEEKRKKKKTKNPPLSE